MFPALPGLNSPLRFLDEKGRMMYGEKERRDTMSFMSLQNRLAGEVLKVIGEVTPGRARCDGVNVT
jgi:hypothetical protein